MNELRPDSSGRGLDTCGSPQPDVGAVRHDVPLGPLTTLRCGGPATTLIEVASDADLVNEVAAADERGEQLLLLGRGSNLVIADAGFEGTAVHVETRGFDVSFEDEMATITAAAGEPWDLVVARCVSEGLVGVEALAGIPGTVGAAPIQNIGAYGADVATVLKLVLVYDRAQRRVRRIGVADCGFGYRDSRFKRERDRWVVIAIELQLPRHERGAMINYADLAKRLDVNVGDRVDPALVRRAVLALRREKGMVLDIEDRDTWSVGSFFVNPVVRAEQAAALPSTAPRWPIGHEGRGMPVKLSAAWLIEQAGFAKGRRLYPAAPAAVSTKHTLAVTNQGEATTADILELARAMRDAVRQQFGIELVPEPTLIGCQL